MMSLPATIRINEVGPRDGLQNEKAIVRTDVKVELIDLLSQTGVAEIEVSSFVSPKWVPQLADADDVFSKINRREGVLYSALVPNLKGFERALQAHVDKISIFASASETFSQKNINATIAESIDRFVPLIAEAKQARLPIRGYISCVVACPYEGPVDPIAVRELAQRLIDLGVDEIDLGETIGVAVPTDIEFLYDELDGLLDPVQTTLHLHNTRGTALACAYRALQLGVSRSSSRRGVTSPWPWGGT
jgi:hydroxymethylglutaryl-CoA lyase